LVTDLPADFEVFGQAVATSMADLLGGTTGQVLSKTSNTNMDFTWVTPEVGDITAVTAGTGITGGGTSGAVTVSFDQANFGGGQYAAGKNKLLNGDFNINQRSFTSTTTHATVTFDRYRALLTGGTSTLTNETFASGDVPITGYPATNYMRIVSSGQSAAGDRTALRNSIEDVRTLAGQTVTASFYAKSASGTPSVAVGVEQAFGTGGSTTVNANIGKTAISTTWTRYSMTVTLPSISGKTIGAGNNLGFRFWTSAGSDFNTETNSLGLQSADISVWGFQLEAGSFATPFQIATGTLPGELAACQRYYYRASASALYTILSTYSNALTTAIVDCVIPTPVQLRNFGGVIDTSNISVSDGTTYYSSGTFSVSASTYGNNYPSVRYTHGSAALTLYRGYAITANNNASAYIGLSAEL
jgi:hypothetical protein